MMNQRQMLLKVLTELAFEEYCCMPIENNISPEKELEMIEQEAEKGSTLEGIQDIAWEKDARIYRIWAFINGAHKVVELSDHVPDMPYSTPRQRYNNRDKKPWPHVSPDKSLNNQFYISICHYDVFVNGEPIAGHYYNAECPCYKKERVL